MKSHISFILYVVVSMSSLIELSSWYVMQVLFWRFSTCISLYFHRNQDDALNKIDYSVLCIRSVSFGIVFVCFIFYLKRNTLEANAWTKSTFQNGKQNKMHKIFICNRECTRNTIFYYFCENSNKKMCFQVKEKENF